jgi:hypothetical protein
MLFLSMDFGLRSTRNRGLAGGDLGWCDITSLLVKRRGHDRYDYGLTLQGCVIRPAPETTASATRRPAPPPNISISERVQLDEDALFEQLNGLRDIFSHAVQPVGLGYGESRAPLPKQNLQGDSTHNHTVADASNYFDLDTLICSEPCRSQEAVGDDDERFVTPLDDSTFGDFVQELENGIPSEHFERAEELDISFTSETIFGTENSTPIQPSSAEEVDYTLILSSPNETSQLANTFNGRQFCRLCNATFKRPGDVKRHARVHYPEQRNFHCREPHCGRNGKHGFYRKDKLRAHQRQVHNM